MLLWVKLFVVQFVFRRFGRLLWFILLKKFLSPLKSEAFLFRLSCLHLPLYQWLRFLRWLWLLLRRVDKVVHTRFLSWSYWSCIVVVEGIHRRFEITLRRLHAWLLEELPVLVVVDFCSVEAWTWFWDRALRWDSRSTSRKCAWTRYFIGISIVLLSKLLPQFVYIGHELILDLLANLGLAMTLLFLSISFIEQVTTTINLRLTEQMIVRFIPKLSHLGLHRRHVQYVLYTGSIFLILQ